MLIKSYKDDLFKNGATVKLKNNTFNVVNEWNIIWETELKVRFIIKNIELNGMCINVHKDEIEIVKIKNLPLQNEI